MNKYIDAEKLIAEIKRRIEETKSMKPAFDQFWAGQISAFKGAIKITESLQQEQPEVDLEKEIEEMWNSRFNLGWDEHSALSMNHEGFVYIARHFYELGINARKEGL